MPIPNAPRPPPPTHTPLRDFSTRTNLHTMVVVLRGTYDILVINFECLFFFKEIWSVQDLQWFSTNPTVRKMAEVHEEFTCCDCDVLFPSTSSVFYFFHALGTKSPADIYLFKVNNRNSRKRCEKTRTTSPVKSLNSLNCSAIFLYLKCTWRRSLFRSDS